MRDRKNEDIKIKKSLNNFLEGLSNFIYLCSFSFAKSFDRIRLFDRGVFLAEK